MLCWPCMELREKLAICTYMRAVTQYCDKDLSCFENHLPVLPNVKTYDAFVADDSWPIILDREQRASCFTRGMTGAASRGVAGLM